ncbi:MAG: hypothetical protein R2867_24090 [Caldilineaceae bacterium]
MSLTNAELRQPAKQAKPVSGQFIDRTVVADATFLLSAIALAALAYGLFYVPAIFMDDWTSVLERVLTGEAKWLDLTDSRHLLFTPFLLQYHLVGVQIHVYHFILIALTVLMALLFYKIVSRLPIVHAKSFGGVVALIFLLYPTNYTHMWLIMLGVSCAIVLTLLYAYLLLRYAEGGHRLQLIGALACLLLSLGIYEAQIGVVSVWAVTLLLLYRQQPLRAA